MKKHQLYIILIFSITTFCTTQRNIDVKINPSKHYNIIGWYNPESKKIGAISFPFILDIESNKKEFLYTYRYKYKNSKKGAFVDIYNVNKGSKLERLKSYEKRSFNSNKKKRNSYFTQDI